MMSRVKRRDITTHYEPLAIHPEGLKPPYPCNRWCVKKTKTHDGEVLSEDIMPWLDECKDKSVPCGAVLRDGEIVPAFRPHQGFDEIDYIVMEENAFKYDDEGNIVIEKDENEHETPVADFRYVAGIAAIAFIAEHTFRIAGAAAQTSQQFIGAMQALNNNVVQLCKIQSHALKLQIGDDGQQIREVQDQTGNAPRIVT
jgi:hypothetical protein